MEQKCNGKTIKIDRLRRPFALIFCCSMTEANIAFFVTKNAMFRTNYCIKSVIWEFLYSLQLALPLIPSHNLR